MTAAPYVLAELPLSDNLIWVTNAFFPRSSALQPLLGQPFNLFGCRWVTLCIVATFLLGTASFYSYIVSFRYV